MYTINSVMTQLTDPKTILPNVHDILRNIDPAFEEEEKQYYQTLEILQREVGDSISPNVSEYMAANEQKICAELVYAAWLGFQQNLECFQNPVNTMFLGMDHEDFLRERRMHTLPEVEKSLEVINDFHAAFRALSDEKHNLTEGIIDYICYLETTGYKLAHYFGFMLADQFLGHVIPGYTSDRVTTIRYSMSLEDYLQLDLDKLQ